MNVFLSDTGNLPDPVDCPQYLNEVVPSRRERVLRAATPKARKERLGADLLIKKILPHFGAAYEELQTAKGGKPYVGGVEFNLSHGGGKVLLAVDHLPVGCDIEEVRSAPTRVAYGRFSQKEKALLENCDDYNQTFFRLWTAKESFLKMTGEGLKGLKEVEIDLPEKRVYFKGELASCNLRFYPIANFIACVCSQSPVPDTLQVISLSSRNQCHSE